MTVPDLLTEYDRARAYTESLWDDLTEDEVHFRPHAHASAIGWHLGHQAAVAHFMVRNLIAAEPAIDPVLDTLMDSATPEPDRGELPGVGRLRGLRSVVAERLHVRIGDVVDGRVGAPRQLAVVASTLLVAVVNHEYQHSTWIAEVRSRDLGRPLPDRPSSDLVVDVDGYPVMAT